MLCSWSPDQGPASEQQSTMRARRRSNPEGGIMLRLRHLWRFYLLLDKDPGQTVGVFIFVNVNLVSPYRF